MKKILLVLCVLICLILGCDKKDTPSVQTDCWKFSVPDSKDYMPSVICGETETEIMERAMRLEELIGLPVVVEKIADWDTKAAAPKSGCPHQQSASWAVARSRPPIITV